MFSLHNYSEWLQSDFVMAVIGLWLVAIRLVVKVLSRDWAIIRSMYRKR